MVAGSDIGADSLSGLFIYKFKFIYINLIFHYFVNTYIIYTKCHLILLNNVSVAKQSVAFLIN